MRPWLICLSFIGVISACGTVETGAPVLAEPVSQELAEDVPRASNLEGSVANTPFAELVRASVANAPTSSAGVASIVAARSRIKAEKGAFLPQINAETSITSGGDAVPILRMSQIIYDGGKGAGRVALRRSEARETWLSEISSLSALSFEAVETIVDLDRNRALEEQAQRNLSRTRSLVADLQSRFDAGAGSVADLLAGQGRQSNAESELAQAQTDVALATATWVEVFGAPPSGIPKIPAAPHLGRRSLEELVARSPRLRGQIAASAIRENEVTLAKRATRPTLSAILETDFNQGTLPSDANARLGIDVPIYRGGIARANIDTAEAGLEQSRAGEEALRRELLRSLAQALEETSSIQGRLASARRAVRTNEKALEAARGQVDIGRGTLVQTLDALRELNTAQTRIIQLQAQARRAEYAVLAVTGDILDALGIAQPVDPTL